MSAIASLAGFGVALGAAIAGATHIAIIGAIVAIAAFFVSTLEKP